MARKTKVHPLPESPEKVLPAAETDRAAAHSVTVSPRQALRAPALPAEIASKPAGSPF
jgi:hypothetical protein